MSWFWRRDPTDPVKVARESYIDDRLEAIVADLTRIYGNLIYARGKSSDALEELEIKQANPATPQPELDQARQELRATEQNLVALDAQLRALERRAKREFPKEFRFLP